MTKALKIILRRVKLPSPDGGHKLMSRLINQQEPLVRAIVILNITVCGAADVERVIDLSFSIGELLCEKWKGKTEVHAQQNHSQYSQVD
jgi:hypothetical protein